MRTYWRGLTENGRWQCHELSSEDTILALQVVKMFRASVYKAQSTVLSTQ